MKFSFLMLMMLAAVSCGKTNGSDNKSGQEQEQISIPSCGGSELMCGSTTEYVPVVISSTAKFPNKMAIKINGYIAYDECTAATEQDPKFNPKKTHQRFEMSYPFLADEKNADIEIFDRRECTDYDDYYVSFQEELIRSKRNPKKIILRITPDRNYRN